MNIFSFPTKEKLTNALQLLEEIKSESAEGALSLELIAAALIVCFAELQGLREDLYPLKQYLKHKQLEEGAADPKSMNA